MSSDPILQNATPLQSLDYDYMIGSYQQIIQTLGVSVTYMKQNTTITFDQYGNPSPSWTSSTITAVLSDLTVDEYSLVEQGFQPKHYANLWVYEIAPTVGDRVIWKGIVWEVRDSVPIVIGTKVIYYRARLRRVLDSGDLNIGTP